MVCLCACTFLLISLLYHTVVLSFPGLMHATSASLARSSMKCSLYGFTLFLTALVASVYSSFAVVAFTALVRLLLIALFFPLLICTLLTVSAEIQSFC